MDLKTFYQECVKRKVFKGISIYAISSWLIIQVAATTFPYLGFPSEAVTTVIILVLLCFPISILFSWHYNVVREPEDELAEKKDISKEQKSSNRIFYTMISLITGLMLIVIFLVSQKKFNPGSEIPMLSELVSDQVAVMEFSNNSSDPDLEDVGKMVADWVAHGIIEYEIAPVLNYESVNEYAALGIGNVLKDNLSRLSNVTSFAKMIRGAYYLRGDELIFQSEIVDKESGKQFAFPQVTCPKDKPLDGIEKIKQQILSYFLGPEEISEGGYIPLYEAYKNFIKAKEYWEKDLSIVEQYLDMSLSLDSNFYRAAYYQSALYYNVEMYEKADSLVTQYSLRFQDQGENAEWFDYLKLLIDGRYDEGVEKYEKLYRKQPSDLYDNGALMVFNYYYLNRNGENEAVYNLINEEEVDYEHCDYCGVRTRVMVLSHIDQGNIEKAIEQINAHPILHGDKRFAEAMIKAYVRGERKDELEAYFDSRSYKLLSPNHQNYLYFFAAKEYALLGNKLERNKYADLALEEYTLLDNLIMQGRCSYLKEDYVTALAAFEKHNNEWKNNHNGVGNDFSLSRMAAISMMQGKNKEANAIIDQLNFQDKKKEREEREKEKGSEGTRNKLINADAKIINNYRFGRAQYLIAHIYAMAGNTDKTFQMLEQSLLKGKRYGVLYFQNDPYLKEYFEDQRFQKLLTYWNK